VIPVKTAHNINHLKRREHKEVKRRGGMGYKRIKVKRKYFH